MLKLKTLNGIGAAAMLACCIAGGAAHAATTNGFGNGGFEAAATQANPPGGVQFFADNWLGAPTGFYPTRSTDAHTGSYAALLSTTGFGGSTMFQNSVDHGGLPELTAANVGETPVLTFWAKGDAGTTGNVGFNLRYLDGIGNILSNQSNNFFQNSINSSTWTQISFQGAAIPTGTKAVFLEMTTAVGPLLEGRPNAVLVDDLYFGISAVPEPGTYALMLAGLAGVAALARRRRS